MMMLRKLLQDDNGATSIEYGLIASLVALAIVAILATLGTSLNTTFSTVSSQLT